MNILLVDDEIVLTDVLSAYFYGKNNVYILNNPIEAYYYYRENQNFDVVITDFIMPGMNGDEFIEKIFEINPLQQIILLSGILTEKIESLIHKHNDRILFIKKPFDLADFDRVIDLVKVRVEGVN